MLEELANGVGAVYLEAVISTAELLQQAEIMKCRADEQQLDIERLSGLSPQLVGPEEDAMRVVEEERSAELMEEPGCLPRELCVWNFGLHFLELQRRGRNRQNDLRAPEGGSCVCHRYVRGFDRRVAGLKVVCRFHSSFPRTKVSGVPSSGLTKMTSFGSRLGVSNDRKTTGSSRILGSA